MTILLLSNEAEEYQQGRNAQQRGEGWQWDWTPAKQQGWLSAKNGSTPVYTAAHPFVAVSVESVDVDVEVTA